MLKAVKIRLYPNKSQQTYINQLLGAYRFVYNKCLDKKKNAYIKDKSNLTLTHLGKYFHNELTKTEEYSFLNQHNTKILKQSILTLLDSYKRFFINGNGFPKFKSKKDNKQSCRFPVEAISIKNDYLSNKLTLVKQLKNIKFRCSIEYKKYLDKHKNNIKSATLVKTKSNTYYLSILIDGSIDKQLSKPINDIIGIDLGIKDFIVTSNDDRYENIKIIRNNEKKLRKLNRQLSRKKMLPTGEYVFSKKYNKNIEIKKPSNNREKCRIKLAKFNEKLNNIKENYLHQISNKLINENQVISIENLDVSNMIKNHNLAKSISELSLYRFKEMLKYKAEWYGRYIIEVDKYFPSSKLCSNCGYKNNELTLNDRNWICPQCKTEHDRDLNAAINIRNEGQRLFNGSNIGLINSNSINKIPNKELINKEKIGCRTSELTLMESNSLETR